MKAWFWKRNDGLSYWRISVPARLTETGKRQTKYFKTKEEAENAIEELSRGEMDESEIDESATIVTDYSLVWLDILERRLTDIHSIKIQSNGDVIIEFHRNER